jgi:plasmid stabilization system protein ParE
MPSAWTAKDERQYEHIKQSEEERGTSESRAEEIAGRTVNKRRRKEGRTANKTTQGTGNPNRRLEDRSVHELRNIASELKIEGRSKLNKQGLVNEIRKKRG